MLNLKSKRMSVIVLIMTLFAISSPLILFNQQTKVKREVNDSSQAAQPTIEGGSAFEIGSERGPESQYGDSSRVKVDEIVALSGLPEACACVLDVLQPVKTGMATRAQLDIGQLREISVRSVIGAAEVVILLRAVCGEELFVPDRAARFAGDLSAIEFVKLKEPFILCLDWRTWSPVQDAYVHSSQAQEFHSVGTMTQVDEGNHKNNRSELGALLSDTGGRVGLSAVGESRFIHVRAPFKQPYVLVSPTLRNSPAIVRMEGGGEVCLQLESKPSSSDNNNRVTIRLRYLSSMSVAEIPLGVSELLSGAILDGLRPGQYFAEMQSQSSSGLANISRPFEFQVEEGMRTNVKIKAKLEDLEYELKNLDVLLESFDAKRFALMDSVGLSLYGADDFIMRAMPSPTLAVSLSRNVVFAPEADPNSLTLGARISARLPPGRYVWALHQLGVLGCLDYAPEVSDRIHIRIPRSADIALERVREIDGHLVPGPLIFRCIVGDVSLPDTCGGMFGAKREVALDGRVVLPTFAGHIEVMALSNEHVAKVYSWTINEPFEARNLPLQPNPVVQLRIPTEGLPRQLLAEDVIASAVYLGGAWDGTSVPLRCTSLESAEGTTCIRLETSWEGRAQVSVALRDHGQILESTVLVLSDTQTLEIKAAR